MLHAVAIASLILAGVCCLVILADIFVAGHRQNMWIMDVVWPVTALWSGPVGLWAYYAFGRLSTRERVQAARVRGETPPNKKKPFWQITAVGTTHCGAGCSLGDLCAEWFVFFVPLTVFGHEIFGAWLLDYALAFSFGIAFQYFTIKPMKGLSPGKGIVEAVKADSLSLTCWQIGMYGWMAIATFGIFGHELHKTDPVFWFMMQIAMFAGFATAFPVNGWLVKSGIKEKM